MLNLAECHRRQGKTATAWAEFDKALSHGTKVGFSEAVQAATRLRDGLAAKLSRLTVSVPLESAALEGLTVEVDGTPWPRERWNTAFVIDPGPIRVRARARGYKPFAVQVELGADKDTKSVVVMLEVEPPPPTAVTPTAAASRPHREAASGLALGRGRGRGGARRSGARLRDRLAARAQGAGHELRARPSILPARVRLPLRAQPRAARLRALRRAGNRRCPGPRGRGGGARPVFAHPMPSTSLVVSPTTIAVRSTF